MKRLFSAIVLCGLTGCYTYVTVESAVPDTGRDVRVYLSPSQDVDVGGITVRDVTSVEGILYEATSDTLAVWSQWFYSLGGSRYYANGHIHVVPRQNVPRLEVRQLHVQRTIVATALALFAGAGVFTFTADIGGSEGGEPGSGDRQQRIARPIPIGILRAR